MNKIFSKRIFLNHLFGGFKLEGLKLPSLWKAHQEYLLSLSSRNSLCSSKSSSYSFPPVQHLSFVYVSYHNKCVICVSSFPFLFISKTNIASCDVTAKDSLSKSLYLRIDYKVNKNLFGKKRTFLY